MCQGGARQRDGCVPPSVRNRHAPFDERLAVVSAQLPPRQRRADRPLGALTLAVYPSTPWGLAQVRRDGGRNRRGKPDELVSRRSVSSRCMARDGGWCSGSDCVFVDVLGARRARRRARVGQRGTGTRHSPCARLCHVRVVGAAVRHAVTYRWVGAAYEPLQSRVRLGHGRVVVHPESPTRRERIRRGPRIVRRRGGHIVLVQRRFRQALRVLGPVGGGCGRVS